MSVIHISNNLWKKKKPNHFQECEWCGIWLSLWRTQVISGIVYIVYEDEIKCLFLMHHSKCTYIHPEFVICHSVLCSLVWPLYLQDNQRGKQTVSIMKQGDLMPEIFLLKFNPTSETHTHTPPSTWVRPALKLEDIWLVTWSQSL